MSDPASELTEANATRDDALDALESMVEQYLYGEGMPDRYDHAFMSAGEEACEVLVRARPERWRAIPTGVVRLRVDE